MPPPTAKEVLLAPSRDPSASNPSKPPSASWLAFDVEKFAPLIVSLMIAYAAVRNLCAAAVRPLWLDEISTFIIVRQHRVSTMWDALKRGADGLPLPFYLLQWPVANALGNEQVSFRLLSIIGFSITVACLFLLIRKRNSSTAALVCAAIPLVTALFDTYAVEARPYTLVLACLSFALVCYQRAPEFRWMVLMGLSLAFAQALHYYAVLGFMPFVLAEAARTLQVRRVRWSVWFALACGLVPLIGLWTFLSGLKTTYGAHLWAKPTLLGAASSYGWFFNTTFTLGIEFAAVSIMAVILAMFPAPDRGSRVQVEASFHEHVLVLGFLGLPLFCFIVAKLGHGGMTERYTLPTVLGFPLALGYSLPRTGRRTAAVLAGVALCLVVVFVRQESRFWSSYTGRFVSPAASVENFVGSTGYENLPVVISPAGDFLQLAHYASPNWRTRFVAIVDAQKGVAYLGSDSIDIQLDVLRRYAPLQIYDFGAFAADHPVFLLYSAGTIWDWWPRGLSEDGYTLRVLAVKDVYRRVFLVSRNKSAE